MAYETGAATSPGDLLNKLVTFVTGGDFATPWTLDYQVSSLKASLHRDGVYVHFRAGTSAIAVYQSLGWIDSGTALWAHTDDSGQGQASDTDPTSGRRAELDAAGPYTAYHFFAEEGDNPYVHVVVEVTAGQFRQAFGFGNLIKSNDYTGGEYAYTHQIYNTYKNNPAHTAHHMCLDGVYTGTEYAATVHLEGMPNVETGHKWGIVCDAATTDDRAGVDRARLFGSTRGGLWTTYLSWMTSSYINTYKPIIPICVLYREEDLTPDELRWLGVQPGIGIINVSGYAPGETISVGGQDWMVFPWWRKQKTGTAIDESWNAGIAYKKVV